MARLWISLITKSGQTMLTSTPLPASSMRSESRNPINACLLAEYPERSGTPVRPARLATPINKPFDCLRCGSASAVSRTGAK